MSKFYYLLCLEAFLRYQGVEVDYLKPVDRLLSCFSHYNIKLYREENFAVYGTQRPRQVIR